MEREGGQMMIGPAFEEIILLKDMYLPVVRGCLGGSDLRTIKVLDDLNKILSADDALELSNVLHRDISQETERQIGFVRGYQPEVSIEKLKNLLDRIATMYDKQSTMSRTDLIKLLKSQEKLILQQEDQKQSLQDKINQILEFTESIAFNAAEKARITARTSKKHFEKARDTIKTILERRYPNRETPEEVDVKKLQRVYWGTPEEYYK